MVKVYSIIVTYNGEKWIEKCLNSLINSSIQTTIIVIDNNSSDGTKSILKENYPNIILHESTENHGFGRANNLGLKKALNDGADFVLLLNQDAWIEENTIERLLAVANANEKVGILAPLNYSPNGDLESYFQKQLSSKNCPGIISDLFTGKLKDFYEVTFYINASCWLITSNCLNIVGGFDPVFDHYGEDVDYCKRAIFHGLHVGICTTTKEYHARDNYKAKESNFKKLLNANIRGYLNNRVLFELKDLNTVFFSHFLFELITLILLSLKFLIKLSFSFFIIYIVILIKLFYLFPEILVNKNICRKRQPSFLQN